ncbi:MAG: carboxypeptidase regulatory-like domain-containing protein [Candidatus Eisenbacteria bacterium]|nr:carboxypeptidase regulatory-like domain-containing protein [Candidatus Eisenbacteria bacterium]
MQARQRTHVPAPDSPDRFARSPLRGASRIRLAPPGGGWPSLGLGGRAAPNPLLLGFSVLLGLGFAVLPGITPRCHAQSSWSKLPTARERAPRERAPREQGEEGRSRHDEAGRSTAPAPREEQILQGTVRDAQGAPLRGVRISIFVDGRAAAQGVTDPQGGYALALSFDPTRDPTIVAVYTPSQEELAGEYLLLRETEAGSALWGPCIPRAAFGSRQEGEARRDDASIAEGTTIYDLTLISGWDRRAAQLESDCWRDDRMKPPAGAARTE